MKVRNAGKSPKELSCIHSGFAYDHKRKADALVSLVMVMRKPLGLRVLPNLLRSLNTVR